MVLLISCISLLRPYQLWIFLFLTPYFLDVVLYFHSQSSQVRVVLYQLYSEDLKPEIFKQ